MFDLSKHPGLKSLTVTHKDRLYKGILDHDNLLKAWRRADSTTWLWVHKDFREND